MANPYQRARQGILAAGRPPTGAPPLYPDAIMRQPAPKAAPAGRQRSPWEQFSYYAGPHLAAAVEPFATAGGAIYDAFKKNPSEFTSFGGVMPAWRQAGKPGTLGNIQKLWHMALSRLPKGCLTLSRQVKARQSRRQWRRVCPPCYSLLRRHRRGAGLPVES